MNKPTRITLSRQKGWRMPPNTVKVCRPGIWGNPFAVSLDLSAFEAVAMHKEWLGGADWTAWMWSHHRRHLLRHDVRSKWGKFEALLADLRGKNLACWCKPDQPCHADTLLKLANF